MPYCDGVDWTPLTVYRDHTGRYRTALDPFGCPWRTCPSQPKMPHVVSVAIGDVSAAPSPGGPIRYIFSTVYSAPGQIHPRSLCIGNFCELDRDPRIQVT
jgi:hypothetical protein